MSRPSNERRRHAAPEDLRASPRGRLVTAGSVALALVYGAIFFAAPLAELNDASRVELLENSVLLADEVAASWTGDPAEFALADRLRVLLPAVALLGICGLAGWLALGALRAERGLSALEAFFFSCAIGCSIISLYTLLVGLAGGLHYKLLFVAPAMVVVVAGSWQLWRRRFAREKHEELITNEQDYATNVRWLWCGAPFVVVIALGGTLTPVDFDVREYHLQVPKEFYQNGRIDFLPHNVYGNMPLGSEMLCLAAMALTGDWWFGALVGKTVMALAAPLTALGLFAAGQRLVSTITGVVAALTYISIPWIVRVSTLGLIEGMSAFYLWGTIFAVVLWWRADRGNALPRLLLAGFLAGSAAACKYPNVLFVLAPAFLVVALRAWRQAAARQASTAADDVSPVRGAWLMPVACFLLASGAACGPWFAKNWWLTGDPVYPLAYKFFDGRTRNAELDAQWNRAHGPPGFRPAQFFASAANFAWRSPWLSPLVLPLAILGVVGSCYRRIGIGLAVYALFVLAIWWLLTHRIDRFWIPIFPVLAFLAGLAVSPGAIIAWRLPLKLVLAGGLVVNLILIVAGSGGDIAYFVSLDHLEHDGFRVRAGHQYLNEHLSDDDLVLLVGDAEVFDLRIPFLYNTVFDLDRFEALMAGRTADEQRRALAVLGVTHVAVAWNEIARYRSPGNYGFTDYIYPPLFDELVQAQVLDSPLLLPDEEESPLRRFQLYPVHDASNAAER